MIEFFEEDGSVSQFNVKFERFDYSKQTKKEISRRRDGSFDVIGYYETDTYAVTTESIDPLDYDKMVRFAGLVNKGQTFNILNPDTGLMELVAITNGDVSLERVGFRIKMYKMSFNAEVIK